MSSTAALKPTDPINYGLPAAGRQSDILYGPYLPDPKNPERKKRTYLAAFIDDHSRLVPHAEFYLSADRQVGMKNIPP